MTLGTVFMMYPVAVTALYVCLRPNEYPPKEFAEVGLILLILYELMNVLLTITFITPYRKFTLALVHGKWPEVRKLWQNEDSNYQQRTKNTTIIRLRASNKVRSQSQ
jgi:uncharacterized protein YeaC (DUF1315 family)